MDENEIRYTPSFEGQTVRYAGHFTVSNSKYLFVNRVQPVILVEFLVTNFQNIVTKREFIVLNAKIIPVIIVFDLEINSVLYCIMMVIVERLQCIWESSI